MLRLPIFNKDLPALLLQAGVSCRINFHETLVKREEGYLVYQDAKGKINRCKIILAEPQSDLVVFHCKSHGMADEKHTLIGLDGEIEV